MHAAQQAVSSAVLNPLLYNTGYRPAHYPHVSPINPQHISPSVLCVLHGLLHASVGWIPLV